ncbi:transglutaminase domain-containing protein [Halapricum hydrolyticum]|uniref:Transglutaminase-like domain-containing protein n=1 Tax=Halapricum hydrolyticum TaxID=2979991 RepID=A0AAE3I9C8_9EURY|nr:transglutaminase domain-containing protein [Halapricum hydrolyticum]MCU4718231.1 hypothetical protein [Halapricum hydrolyticum]MCU4726328.1 hypothetical protein [Halapricum hydrolyticum]
MSDSTARESDARRGSRRRSTDRPLLPETLRRHVAAPRMSALRLASLLAAGLVLVSVLATVYRVLDVVGDPTDVLGLAAVIIVAATLGARLFGVRQAAITAGGLLAVGLGWYLAELPTENTFALAVHVEYVLALLSGRSILEIVNVEQWLLAVTPAPVFLTWFLALRHRYVLAAVAGGSAVGFVVLTGDATLPVATMGCVGALALLGFGTLERAGGTISDADVVVVVLAVAVGASLSITLVPQEATMTYSPGVGFERATEYATEGTLEADLLATNDRVRIGGRTELSAETRWTVESDRERYWRVGAYDLYTGEGWIRRPNSIAETSVRRAAAETVTQRFTAESRIATVPAAWRPIGVEGIDVRTTVFRGFEPIGSLQPGESYVAESRVIDPSPSQLRRAGDSYPETVTSRFLQVPDSTPDRVAQAAEAVAGDAETPYGTAVRIEGWLKNTKDYSLSIDRPSGDIADSFLFEMEAGYCTYFATTMVVMLRTQGVPARLAVGYTPGERVGDDTWRVRGYNSHSWVEVYFPEVGWVQFDPTPSQPREQAASEQFPDVETASDSESDTGENSEESGSGPTPDAGRVPGWVPDPDSGGSDPAGQSDATDTRTPIPADDSGPTLQDPAINAPSVDRPDRPGWERLLLGSIVVVGLLAGVRRSGAFGRLYRVIWLRWQPRSDPMTDLTRAYDRLEYLFERVHRPRRAGETPRQYFEAIEADERAMTVRRRYEQARYAGEVDPAAADRAVALADAVVAEHVRFVVAGPDSV